METHLSQSTTPESQKTRNLFFADPLFEDFAVRALSLDGCPLGEVSATTSRIEEGNRNGWYEQWTATADRVAALGDESARAGHTVSARDAYLRASSYYRTAYLPLYGSPVDPRLVQAFDKETTVFQKAAALMKPPVEPVEIPYEGTTLPGYSCRVDDSGRPRPTLVCTNGYDSTINEMYVTFATALARGYNLLLFDGPGQGRPLIEQGLVFRPDWENVVILGWSFGGYLAPRAASGEHRLAACIADPGFWDLFEANKAGLSMLPKETFNKLPDVDPSVLEPFMEKIRADPKLRWSIVQRNFWVHGIDSLLEFLKISEDYSLKEMAAQIRCPTLLGWSESDPLSWNAERIYDSLTCPRKLVRFMNAEGAGDHCEVRARRLFDQRAFDWLDETLGVSTGTKGGT